PEPGTEWLAAVPAARARRIGDRLAIRFPGRALRRRERGHLKVGMAGERGEKLLAGDAGRADDRDSDRFHVSHPNTSGAPKWPPTPPTLRARRRSRTRSSSTVSSRAILPCTLGQSP